MTTQFSDKELKHIALNAMGRASEVGSAAGFQLGFASNFVNGMPVNNSGYTLGYMQVDFGAHPGKTAPLVNAYNTWAQENGKTVITDVDNANYLLQQNKNKVEKLQRNNPDIKYIDIRKNNHPLGKQLREFLGTEAGFDYIMSLQESAYKDIEGNIKDVMKTDSFKGMSHAEQVEVLSVVAKISNQAGSGSGNATAMVKLLTKAPTPISFATFKAGATTITNNAPWLKSGFEDTVKGAGLYNTLTNDTGPLGEMFRDRLEQNPYDLTKEEFVTNPHEQFMDTLFRYPDQAKKIIDALNNDKDIVINPTGPAYLLKDIKNETYTIGVKDGVLFSIDKDGHAHRMDDKGQWIAFDNDKNPLIHSNDKGDWTLTPHDLALNHKGQDVLELQAKLNALGHTVAIDEKSPVYDQATIDQVKAFQEAQGLTVTGNIDSTTRTAIDNKLNEQNKHLPFVRSSGKTPNIDQQIVDKFAELDKLNGQLKDYDPIRDIGEIVATEVDREQIRNELAQLEQARQFSLDAQKNSLQNELIGLRGQEATESQEKQIGTIELAQVQKDNAQALVDALKSDPITDQMNIGAVAVTTKIASLAAARITLATPAEQAFAGQESFKSTDTAAVSALQDVLYERNLMTSSTRGPFGPQTQKALRMALGLPDNHDFKGEVTQEMLDQLKPTDAMIEARANEALTKASNQVATLENQAATIDKALVNIEAKRPSIIDQKIGTETDNIKKLQSNITNYDQDKLNPLKNIQEQLTEHTQNSTNHTGEDSANNTSTTAYQFVAKALTDNNISVLSSEQDTFFNSTNLLSRGGKSNNIEDVKAVQTFLIEKEYLASTWTDAKGNIHPSNDGDFGGGTTKAIKAYQLAHQLKSDGVVGSDFRAAMKTDVLNDLTAEEITQKVQVELDALTKQKTTAISEINNEIKDTQAHIDQLQGEKTVLLTNQLVIQQEKQQELTDKIAQNQETVKNIETLKTTVPSETTLSDPAYTSVLTEKGIEFDKNPPESSVHALLDERKIALEAEIKADQAQLATLEPVIESTKTQLTERGITPTEKTIEEPNQIVNQETKAPTVDASIIPPVSEPTEAVSKESEGVTQDTVDPPYQSRLIQDVHQAAIDALQSHPDHQPPAIPVTLERSCGDPGLDKLYLMAANNDFQGMMDFLPKLMQREDFVEINHQLDQAVAQIRIEEQQHQKALEQQELLEKQQHAMIDKGRSIC